MPWLPVVVALLIIGADQLTKLWALTSLELGEVVPVLGEALQWLLIKNPGAAFSFAAGATWVFTIISGSVAIIIVTMLHRVRSVVWAVLAGLVLGGTIGNLLDRLFREPGFGTGHVIDFIYTPWMMPAIYNVADIAVVSGMGLFILLTLLGVGADGKRRRAEPKAVDSEEPRS